MKIRSLTLENVRRFGGQRLSINGIGDGITVVSEPNEFGKSTFFDALHALFFEKHTSSGRTVQSLRPHAGGGVAVRGEIELETGRFALEKRFLSRKSATVTDLGTGQVIARDGEAEDWIAAQIGAADKGPAGLLWVRQGVVGLEPADAKPAERDQLTEARRDLLSSVAGEIDKVTGGRRMDRILRRCSEDLAQLATGTRLSPRGAWKEAVDAVGDLERECATLEAQCKELAEALEERRIIAAEIARLDAREAKARRDEDLARARAAAEEARQYAEKIEALRRDAEISGLTCKDAERSQVELSKAIETAESLVVELSKAKAVWTAAHQRLELARDKERDLRTRLETATAQTHALRTETARAGQLEAARRAAARATELTKTLELAKARAKSRADARARVQANPVTPEMLQEYETASAEHARLLAAASAQSVQMTLFYSGATRARSGETELPASVPVAITDGYELELPGLGSARFAVPDGSSAAALAGEIAAVSAREEAARKACGGGALAEARQRAQTRQADMAAGELAAEMLRTLAPQGLDALETELAEAVAVASETTRDDSRDAETIADELETALDSESDCRGRLGAATEAVSDARASLATAEAEMRALSGQKQKADDAAGPEATRSERLSAAVYRVDAARAELIARQESLAGVLSQAPDLATAQAGLTRAEQSLEAVRVRREQLSERRADLSARIETRADEGVEERHGEIAERLETMRARGARYEAEVAALVALREALESARQAAQEAYFEPVQEELRPLLAILHDDAAVDWEADNLIPGALRRGASVEAFDTLSGGTQEQLAILTRLAFARLFARRGQHVPIVLDDALVYSDDDRIVKMFTALNRVASEQQILVFSCRQLAFSALGGERPKIVRMAME